MYWHTFTDEEERKASRQAEAQTNDLDEGSASPKTVGNLGELAFYQFLKTTVGEPPEDHPTWKYHNEDAMESAEAEYSETDFQVGWYAVDVKTTYDIRKFDSGGLLWTDGDTPDVDTDSDSDDCYVFVVLSDNDGDKVANILGWAEEGEIRRDALSLRWGSGSIQLRLRGLSELLIRAGFSIKSPKKVQASFSDHSD